MQIIEARQLIEKAGKSAAESHGNATDPLARNKALYRLIKRDAGAAVIFFALMLAMMIVESMSVLMKLMAARGSYEEALDAAQQGEINSIQKAAQRAEQEDRFEDACETILQSETERIVTALTSSDRSSLTDAQQELAEAFESRVIGSLNSKLRLQPEADEAPAVAQPSASPSIEFSAQQAIAVAEAVNKATLFFKVFEAEQRDQECEPFAVTLNQAAKDVRLSDIEPVLVELRSAWLPPDAQLPACGFFLSNSLDKPLRFGLPVFAQLGNVPLIHAYFVEGGNDAETIH